MRFVKNLIATAALATVVAGLPAGNTNNPPDDDTLGKESTVVPGASTTASIPVHSSFGPIITTESNMISDPVSIYQGIPTTHVTLTGGMPLVVVDAPQATVDGPQATVDAARQATVDGPQATVDARQATDDGPQVPVDTRQATVDGPQATVDSQDTHVTYLPKPPTGPGGSHPDVEARQMLPIASSSSAISKRQMLPIASSSSAISARSVETYPPGTPWGRPSQPNPNVKAGDAISARDGEAHTSPGTPWGRQPNPNVKVGGAISTVIETSLHTVTATPSPTKDVTVTMTETRPATTTCTSTSEPETTVTRTKTLSKDSAPEQHTTDVPPVNSPTTITTTTCSHHSCATFTIISTAVVTPSSSTFTGGPWTPTPDVDAVTAYPLPSLSSTSSEEVTVITQTTDITTTLTPTGEDKIGPVTPPFGDPTFSVDPSDLPTMPPNKVDPVPPHFGDPTFSVDPTDLPTMPPKKIGPVTPPFGDPTFSVDPSDLPTMPPKRDEQSITLTASYTITITEFPSETAQAANEKVDPVPPHFGDPTFSVDPTDLPTMPPARRDQDPTFSVDPSDLPTMPPAAHNEQSITLTASYTITITEFPTSTPTGEDNEKVDPVPPLFGDPTFSVDPTDLPTMPPKRDGHEQDHDVSITATAPYTITFSESIPIPTLDPSWSSLFPTSNTPFTRRAGGGDWVDPPEAGPLDPRPPFASYTDGPVNSHTYTRTPLPSRTLPTGRPHPTTLVTSVAVRSAA